MSKIRILPAYDYAEDVCQLFMEYTDMMVEGDPAFAGYLRLQNYDEELKHLEVKYGEPNGRLYIVFVDEKVAGCIGIKKIDEQNCEMKRLYVRKEFRGNKIGDLLVKKVIDDARKIGYTYMLLDTLPFLQTAITMYKRFGFYEIESYNGSPMDGLVYLKLEL